MFHKISSLFQSALEAQKIGNLDEASTLCVQILQQKPNHFDALLLSGVITYELGDYIASAQLILSAIKLDQSKPEAYLNLGAVFKKLNSLDSSLKSFDKALELNPQYADAYYNRGNVLVALHRYQEAIESFNQALKLNPNQVGIIYNRANAYRELKQFQHALNDYDVVIQNDPNHALSYWNKSWVLLLLGQFEEAWPLYEWRWRNINLSNYAEKRVFNEPLWLGKESLENKTILIRAEQGLGDTIQFCRYVEKVAAFGANIIFEVQPALVSLLKPLESIQMGRVQVIQQNETLPHFDFQCPLLSMPYAFNTYLNNIPAKHAYLETNQYLLSAWNNKLGKKNKLRVGVVWRGGVHPSVDHRRSIALSDFVSVLSNDIQFICLQKEVFEDEQMILEKNLQILNFTNDLHDFDETAALCALMDIVITVDTSVAHLAGALGKKTWLILPTNPDWRWMLERNDSPWYPTMTLYRQKEHSKWQDVLMRIKKDLIALN